MNPSSKKEQKIGKAAVYKILNTITNKVYIGSCKGHYLRKGQHWYKLRRGVHDNYKLQEDWADYGESAFKFVPIEFVIDTNTLINREQFWLDLYDSSSPGIGYNISPTAGSNLGIKMRAVSRVRMSLAKKGKKQSSEAIKKRAASCCKCVEQYTLSWLLVGKFVSVKAAASAANIDRGSISKAASNKCSNKTAGGFFWRFGTK
jgi:hypothetical protein